MSLNTTAVRIKVTLKDVKPEVMRRLVVPVTLRLDRLHLTLQAAFGWTNSHLFEAAGRCPPEDVGGAPGYAEYLEAIGDPTHPEHEHMRLWRQRATRTK